MSNPLRWFRQNAKVMVVVLGIGAMAIFGLGPVFDVLSRPSSYQGPGENPAIAKWSGGDLTRNQLDDMRYMHYDVLRFQEGLRDAAVQQLGDDYQPYVAPIQPLQNSDGTAKAAVDNQLIERFLLAEKAKQEGFVVSDEMIDSYLALLAGDAEFSRADFQAINREVNGRKSSLAKIRNQLEVELLYRQMNQSSQFGMPRVPSPTEAMELHGKVTSRTECEVIAVPVSQFVDQVSDEPSNSELRALYNEGKYDYPDPTGQKPGFKIGRKLVAQYFVADFDTFLTNEMNKLSAAEVQAEYDRLVEAKDDLVMEVVPEDLESSDADSSDGEAKETDQSIRVRKSKAARVSYRTQEEVADEVAAATPAVEATPQEVTEPKVTEEASTASEAAPEAKAETATESTDASAQTEDASADTADASAKSETGEPAADATDDVKPAAEDKPAKPAATDDVKSDSTDDVIGPLLGDTPKLKKRAKPLKEVADTIKRLLSTKDAQAAIERHVEQASDALSDYRAAYMSWKNAPESDRPDVPPSFDHEGLAKEFNLISNETPLVDDVGMAEEALGRVMMRVNVMMRTGLTRPDTIPVANYLFNNFEKLDLFEAETTENFFDRSTYLIWLSDKREPSVPDFAECRDQVIEFAKQRQAYELAEAEAAKLAESMSGKRDQKLSEVYPERAIQTGEFTWFSNVGRPAISSVIGVGSPGDDFMETAFGLDKLEVGTSANSTKDTIYVVQRTTDPANIDEVASDYLENQFFKFKAIPTQVRDTAAWYRREMNYDWSDEFVDDMGYEILAY